MNACEAISYIESTHKFGTRLGLESMGRLLSAMGNPHDQLKFIHLAGTNGKGSTSTMIARILTAANYKTGLFTSPFLEKFNERIQVDNTPVDDEGLVSATLFVKERVDQLLLEGHPHPTEFELVTAVGLRYFIEQQVDYVVLEVGMGGRLDATNIISHPLAVVIMGIGLDHVDYLGDTLAKVAYEKAAIIKEGRPVIVYPQKPEALEVIKDFAAAKKAPLTLVDPDDIKILSQNYQNQVLQYQGDHLSIGEFKLKLLGNHQSLNCLTALEVIYILRQEGLVIEDPAIKEALATVTFPGRFEIFSQSPVILIDGAHNRDGIEAFVANLADYFPNQPINLYFGMLEDKDIEAALELLVPLSAQIHTLTPNSDRAMSAAEMAHLIERKYQKEVDFYDSIEAAVLSIDRSKTDAVNVFIGSLYLIGEARSQIRKLLALT